MAEIRPLRALHYDPARDPLQDVVAPPYDVIDDEQRAALQARSPHNVVAIDLPQGDDPYAAAAETFAAWKREGVLAQDDDDAFWVLTQDYDAPDGARRTRSGFFARVRVEDYGPGRIRPHERTHPGPKEDRLRLTRATKANLSPIFSLYSDPEQRGMEGARTQRSRPPPSASRPTTTAPTTASGGSPTRRPSQTSRQRSHKPSSSSPTATTATRPPASTRTRSAARARTATSSCASSRSRTRA